ncbi:MAG: GFA family protein [Gammaproteobacteria bacterium]|nr:GFA family protein [Gammaproteobacteria bacterium]NNF61950.1 GFA family protein [Gammaproteobacteria bacterium]NNM21164.1 GFA family protein [Gammaproteobacteria bacterium]
MSALLEHTGGCHCGAVRFVAKAPADAVVQTCNCSICSMTGFVHLIVPAARFHLLEGEDALTTYTFNTGVAKHMFCRLCGIKSFYVPRSNPDGYSINVNCIDSDTTAGFNKENFDGRNWEQNAAGLRHLSED